MALKISWTGRYLYNGWHSCGGNREFAGGAQDVFAELTRDFLEMPEHLRPMDVEVWDRESGEKLVLADRNPFLKAIYVS